MPWCKKLLLVVMMLFVPLQAGAAAATALFCHESTTAAHAFLEDAGATHAHAPEPGGSPHTHTHDGPQPTGGEPSGHTCCGHAIFSLPAVTPVAFARESPVWSLRSPSFFALFFPEQPHRPPLA